MTDDTHGLELKFTFPLAAGLHARPASLLQEQAARFRSAVLFENKANGALADAKSTLALVSTVTRMGDPCTLRVEGEDEREAFAVLKRFVAETLPHADDAAPPPGPSAAPPGTRPLPHTLRDAPHLAGIPVSPGVAWGPARLLRRFDPFSALPKDPPRSPEEEESCFQDAVRRVAGEIETRLQARPAGTQAAVLKAHLSILQDRGFALKVQEALRKGNVNAGGAIAEASSHFEEILRRSGSAYLQERAEDVRDVAGRLVRAIYGLEPPRAAHLLTEDTICVAETLQPSEYVDLDKWFLKGLILVRGEAASHTVILARADGIPCVSGVREAFRRITDGEEIMLDARRGLVMLPPLSDTVRRYFDFEMHLSARREAQIAGTMLQPGASADGQKLEVGANAASLADVETAFRHGAEGIGVLRTEILFVNRKELPSEEEQTAVYTAVLKAAAGKPVIIRTLDVGGDKPLPSLPMPEEDNPFLGYRAVRMYDDIPEVIDAQIRAVLRASPAGAARIMVPMISTVAEMRAFRARVQRCRDELLGQGVPVADTVPVGMMIEVPSVLFEMDHFCAYADFFSIGSNDLTQYLLAVDRGNEKLRGLYSPWQPALLRSLELAVREARRHGRWIGICGEMAGFEPALPLFVGIGIDEISVGPGRVPWLKATLHRLSSEECRQITVKVLAAESSAEAERLLGSFLRDPTRMRLASSDLIEIDSPAQTKDEAIRGAVALLDAAGRVDNPDRVEEAVWQREATFPTGMGYGIAIPHCKSSHVVAASVAVLRTSRPVPWKEDEDPVSLVILLAVPENEESDRHLRIIARLARRLMHEEFRAGLLEAKSADAILDLLNREITA